MGTSWHFGVLTLTGTALLQALIRGLIFKTVGHLASWGVKLFSVLLWRKVLAKQTYRWLTATTLLLWKAKTKIAHLQAIMQATSWLGLQLCGCKLESTLLYRLVLALYLSTLIRYLTALVSSTSIPPLYSSHPTLIWLRFRLLSGARHTFKK